jgi:hypothetical protein
MPVTYLRHPLYTLNHTTVERDALSGGGDKGLICFDTTLNQPFYWTGSVWKDIASNGAYQETVLTQISATADANTWTDVTGSNLTINAGDYEIGYFVGLSVRDLSGAVTFVAGNCIVTKSDNTAVAGTLAFIGGHSQAGGIQRRDAYIHARAEISIDAQTTYKLRIRCSAANTDADTRIFAGDLTSDLTTPDIQSYIYAKRLK